MPIAVGDGMTIKTADLFDQFADELQSCDLPLRDYGGRSSFHGPIATVDCREDNLLVRETLAGPGDGRVLVVDGGGSPRTALLGDVLADLGRSNGWAGVIIHGAIRDVEALAALDFGVRALGSNPRKSAKAGAGTVGQPVRFGGVVFVPGYHAYVDADDIAVARWTLHTLAV